MQAPPQLEKSWKEALKEEFDKPYIADLADFVAQERNSGVPVYPPKEQVFAALNTTPYDHVKVVVVGQDPYHGPNQAHGLSFSVCHGIAQPPSLKNIFKELHADLGINPPSHGNLEAWAQQGVLLLNNVLTVRHGSPKSHAGMGWERFTDAVVCKLAQREDSVVFVLWGRAAQEKCARLDLSNHHVLQSVHPSPFAATNGFFGSRPFSKINDLLTKAGKEPIDWEIA